MVDINSMVVVDAMDSTVVDDAIESNVVDCDLRASLPGPRKTSQTLFKNKKHILLNMIKDGNQKLHDLKAVDAYILDQLMSLQGEMNDLLDQCCGDELVLTEDPQSATTTTSTTTTKVPPRSYPYPYEESEIVKQ